MYEYTYSRTSADFRDAMNKKKKQDGQYYKYSELL